MWSQKAQGEGAGAWEGGGVGAGQEGYPEPGVAGHMTSWECRAEGLLVSHLLGPQASHSTLFCASVSSPVKTIAGTLPLMMYSLYECLQNAYYDPGTVQGLGDDGKPKQEPVLPSQGTLDSLSSPG